MTPLLVAVLATAGGCTSAISTAYLRDALWDGSDHAAEEGSRVEDDAAAVPAAGSTADVATPAVGGELDAERREAAIDEAVARLSRAGHLDTAAKAALVQTLQQTAPEDWPVVVDTFAESLAATASTRPDGSLEAASAEASIPDGSPPGPALTDLESERGPRASPDAIAPEPPVDQTPVMHAVVPPAPLPPPSAAEGVDQVGVETPTAAAIGEARAPVVESPSAAVEPVQEFAVRHACFAKRVQGWGVVDRFPESRFAAGQEVIVYVELDHLSAGESPAGHTTCVAAALRLVDDEERTVHEWTFEPIVETCPTRRHDYFARYVIRIPDAAPLGGCRLSIRAVDTLAGRTAATDLPLEVVSRQVAAR
ncbi:MAG: hypothetical protein ACKO4Z_02325 [Planctomycetota bacterium]